MQDDVVRAVESTHSAGEQGSVPATILSVQVLRFFAAFIVVVFHAQEAMRNSIVGHVKTEVDRAFMIGAAGVHLFFLISGFVMVYTTMRPGRKMTTTKFFERRFMRIYPIYWVLALIYLFVRYMVGSAYDISNERLVGAFLLLPNGAGDIIGPGWTLAYEVYFYLCFGLALLFPNRIGLYVLTFAFLGMIAVGVLFPNVGSMLGIMVKPLLLEFLAGCWIAFCYLKGWRLPIWSGVLLVLLGLLGLAAGVPLGLEKYPAVLVWGIPSIPILIGALTLEPIFSKPLPRFLAKLGDSSYFLYLCHSLFIYLLFLTPWLRDLASIPVTAFVTPFVIALTCTAIAHAGHDWIELPLIKTIRNLVDRLTGRRVGVAIATS